MEVGLIAEYCPYCKGKGGLHEECERLVREFTLAQPVDLHELCFVCFQPKGDEIVVWAHEECWDAYTEKYKPNGNLNPQFTNNAADFYFKCPEIQKDFDRYY
jgi:hypothetical protein